MTPKKGAQQFIIVCLVGFLLIAFAYISEMRRGRTVKHKEITTATAKTTEKAEATSVTSAEKTTVETAGRTGTVIERGEQAKKRTVVRTRTIVERDVTTGAVVRETTEREDETEGEDAKLTTETTTIATKNTTEVAEVHVEAAAEAAIEEKTEEKQETVHEVEQGKLSNFGLAATAKLNPMLTYQWKRKGLLSHDLVVEFERKELPKLRGLGFGQFAEYKKFRAGTYEIYNLKERSAEIGIAIGRRF